MIFEQKDGDIMNLESPIGVFDSGVGGLTVLNELISRLPFENFIYIGDTKNSPYGEKDNDTIASYVSNIVKYFENKGVKQVVIACNTATVNSSHLINETNLDIIGVVQPTALKAINTTMTKRVLILATSATIRNGIYQKLLSEQKINAFAVACPKFVPLIEKNMLNTPESFAVVKEVCEPYKDLKIDTVVMGCTHYGLLANEIRQVMGNVNIITSGEATYYVVKDRLKKRNLLNNSQKHGEIKLLTTGSVEVFKKSIGWFKNRIDALEHVSLE